MLIDSFLALVMEHSSFEGNRGDACAESSRYVHNELLNDDYTVLSRVNLKTFVTPLGYIRHPEVPESWKEKDFTSDQAVPLYLAFRKAGMPEALEMEKRIKNYGYRTGNGDYVTPGFFALLTDQNWLLNTSVFIQSLLFKIPFRWSDSKKWFEKTEGSSGDYLNHIHMAVYTHKWIRKLVSKDVLKSKVREYYKPEPNSQWIIDSYDRVLEKYW